MNPAAPADSSASPGFEVIEVRDPQDGGQLVLQVSGNLDQGSSPRFVEAVTAFFAQAAGRGGLHLDLAGLRYLSSAGAGALASLSIAARSARLEFSIGSVTPNVRIVLQLLGLWGWLAPKAEERR